MINYGALAGRPHGGRPTVPILLSEADRAAIVAAMRPAKAEQRVVRRAQALLMMADGVPGTDIARLLPRISTWRPWPGRFSLRAGAERAAACLCSLGPGTGTLAERAFAGAALAA